MCRGAGTPQEGGRREKIKAISADICQEAARAPLGRSRNQVEMTAVSGSTQPTNALSPSPPACATPEDWSCSLKSPEGSSQDTVTAGRKGVRQGLGINRSVAKRHKYEGKETTFLCGLGMRCGKLKIRASPSVGSWRPEGLGRLVLSHGRRARK